MANKFFKDSYDVIIIGGALAGLASALSLAKKGKSVLVLEQHDLPGGVATSFVRGGVEMEAALHEMMSIGSKECPLKVGKFFEEMGVDIEWLKIPEAYRFADAKTGVDVVIHAGTNGDFSTPAKEIAEVCKDKDGSIYKKLIDFFNLCHRVYTSTNAISQKPTSKLTMLVKHTDFVKTAGYSAKQVMDTFALPQKAVDILSAYWIYLGNKLDDLPFTVWAAVIADYLGHGSYIPKKFSHEMSLKMAERAMRMGVQVEFGMRVEKILVKNGHTAGVRLRDGEEVKGEYVVCSAYPDKVYSNMIEPKSAVPDGALKFVNSRTLGLSCFSVVLLLDSDPASLNIKEYATFYAHSGMDEKAVFDNLSSDGPYEYIAATCTNIVNPDCSPQGTTLYTITATPRPEGWLKVTEDNYDELKHRNAESLIGYMSELLGVDLKEHILEIVIETPVSVAHYTGAYRGSVYGYMHTMNDHIVARHQMCGNENYIQGLAFAGAHQILGDGMAVAISNGEKSAEIILDMMKQDKRSAKK